jgi:hypothetical protein
MMRPVSRIFVLAVTLVLATSACGSNPKDSAMAGEISIDLAKLDSGSYPITPLDVEKTRAEDSGAWQEGIRIGNATPLAMDIDNRFIFESHNFYKRVIIPKKSSAVTIASAPGLIAGWYTHGQRRAEANFGRTMQIHTLRFSNADQASTAARLLSDENRGDSLQIPDHPTAHNKYATKVNSGAPWMSSWLVHGDMLLHVTILDPINIPVVPAQLAELTKRVFDKQIDMLKNYSPTPIDQIPSLPLDVDGILSRTLLLEKDRVVTSETYLAAVYPKQAALHPELYPNLAKAAFDDAGVDYVAEAGARVYRTRDASSATRLIAAMHAQVADGYKKMEAPPNLPTAQCFDHDTKADVSSSWRYVAVCWISVDRYVARVTGFGAQDVNQRTAAQYRLLASMR